MKKAEQQVKWKQRQMRWAELFDKVPGEGPYKHAVANTRNQYVAARLSLKPQTIRKWQCNREQGEVRYPPPSDTVLNSFAAIIDAAKVIGF